MLKLYDAIKQKKPGRREGKLPTPRFFTAEAAIESIYVHDVETLEVLVVERFRGERVDLVDVFDHGGCLGIDLAVEFLHVDSLFRGFAPLHGAEGLDEVAARDHLLELQEE